MDRRLKVAVKIVATLLSLAGAVALTYGYMVVRAVHQSEKEGLYS